MRSILIVSHACSRAVNREPYAHMQALGWQVEIVTATGLNHDGQNMPSDAQEPGAPNVRFLRMIGDSPRSYRFEGLRAEISRIRPDWVIADNDPHSMLAVQLVTWKATLGYRLGFLSCENLPFTTRQLWHRRGLRGMALGIFCTATRAWVRRGTDILWVINNAGLELFRNVGFLCVEKTPLGFPESHFFVDVERRTALRRELHLDGPVIGYFGRLSPEKGVHLLLDALEGLNEPWQLVIDKFMPSGDYQNQIWDRLRLPSWANRVRWVEARHGEVAGYMNAVDIVVLPSISTPGWVEQYGRVAPEAMACGCLVIAADSGALPELVADAGWLFPEGDVVALRERLLAALTGLPQQQSLRERASARAREFLSASAQARLWAAVLS